MVVTSILSTEAEMDAMAGENVDSTGWTETNKTAWGIQAEAALNMMSRYDWVTNVGTLGAKSKAILSEYVARSVGMQGILFNFDVINRIEAEDRINVHVMRIIAIEKLLRDQPTVDFLKGT